MATYPKQGINKATQSLSSLIGEDPKELTPQKMKEWNMLLDFIKSKGHEGSTKLDKDKALGQSLFNEFKKANPSVSITYDIVPTVQAEMQRLKTSAQSFAERRSDPNAKNIMSNVSKVDGFLGSKTSQFRFPYMEEAKYRNNNLTSITNLGLVDGNMKPTGINATKKPLPKGAKLEQLQGGVFYEDKDGDLVRYQ